MAFVNKCYQVTSNRLRIGVLKGSVYILFVNKCHQVTSIRLRIGVLKESVYVYRVCQQMLSSHFNSLTHRCIKRICLYIWCLSTNVIKSLRLAYA